MGQYFVVHARLGTASPFNIKVKSLRIGAFTADEVCALRTSGHPAACVMMCRYR